MSRPSAERSRRLYDAHAAEYDRGIGAVERVLFGAHREWAAASAAGAVVELAVGTGLNLPRYGPCVTSVIGIDQSAGMLAVAERRIREHGLADRVELRLGDVQRLELPDRSADTVLATYALCSVPDPLAVLREARRVLRPGGRLVLVEHGVGRNSAVRLLQRLLQPVSVRLAADDLLGDPGRAASGAGFQTLETARAGRGGIVHLVLAARPARI